MMMIGKRALPPFVPGKVHHLVYYVVRFLGREIGAIELMKLIFLIDVTHWRAFGRTITGLQYIRHKKGPFAKAISQAVEDMCGYELRCFNRLSRGLSAFLKKACSVGERPRFQLELTLSEAEIVRQTLRSMGHLNPLELEEQAYNVEPMLAVTQMEARIGSELIGEALDLNLLARDEFMLRWLKNRERAKGEPPDEEYEAYLREERREFEELLSMM